MHRIRILLLCGSGWLTSCAPALTQVPAQHPARASAESTPLPYVAAMLVTDERPAAATSEETPDPHAHHHHGGAHE